VQGTNGGQGERGPLQGGLLLLEGNRLIGRTDLQNGRSRTIRVRPFETAPACPGFAHVLTVFKDMLAAFGVDSAAHEVITVANPARMLTGAAIASA
jgi:hypothetical protein